MQKRLSILLLLLLNLSSGWSQIGKDSIELTQKKPGVSQAKSYKISDSGLSSKITFGSQDSQSLDVKLKKVTLYGQSYVNYENKELKADEVELEVNENIASARKSETNPSGIKPTFNDGGQLVKYDKLRYNFETEKGLLSGAVKQEGEFIVFGDRLKYINEDHDGHKETIINSYKGGITTCDHDHPHFGIRAKKMKFINEKLAVFGPSNLEIGGVPTPLIIPFGFYPLTEGSSTGFIFPQDYQFNSQELGFGLRGFGWYFPLSDYVHMKLTADLYTRGTHGIYLNTDYYKKYKYKGRILLSYNDRRTDDIETIIENGETITRPTVLSEKGFSITVVHDQDSKAHPYVTVGGKVNIVGNNNQNRNFNDAQSVLENRYSSNFYYRHKLPGSPFSLSAGMSHDQNTATRVVNITFPDVDLNMNTIYPFVRKNRGGNEQKWYEKVSFDYDVKMKSFVRATDTTLFTQEMYEDIKTGMSHTVQLGFSTRLFKHFNFVPSASYKEVWVLNSIEKELVDASDSSNFQDSLVTNTVNGFDGYRSFNTGVSVNTQIFGTAEFKKGWLRGIRHTIKPELGFSFAPDTRSQYQDTLVYSDEERSPEIYTRFDSGPFGNPSLNNLQSQLNFRLNNNIEIKYFSKKDSTIKKFKIFDNLTFSGNYNFAKDSLKWSTISVNSTSRLFNGISTITTRWTFDPYQKRNGVSVDEFVYSENKKLVRLETGQVGLTSRLTVEKILEVFGLKSKKNEEKQDSKAPLDAPKERTLDDETVTGPPQRNRSATKNTTTQQKSLAELFESFRIDHNIVYAMKADRDGKISSGITVNSVNLQGSLSLTDNWSVSVGNIGYDFVKQGITYPAITFSRKLHCWDMIFSWYPNRDTYNFSIGVSSNALSFLKYNYGQNNLDGLARRF